MENCIKFNGNHQKNTQKKITKINKNNLWRKKYI